jgi:hypothetical protein
MNILKAKYHDFDKELIESYPNEVLLLNEILKDLDTPEQLSMVYHYLNNFEEMRDMMNVYDIETNESYMKFLLLSIQFSLGAVPKQPRYNSNYL